MHLKFMVKFAEFTTSLTDYHYPAVVQQITWVNLWSLSSAEHLLDISSSSTELCPSNNGLVIKTVIKDNGYWLTKWLTQLTNDVTTVNDILMVSNWGSAELDQLSVGTISCG